MSRKEGYKEHLTDLIDEALKTDNEENLRKFLSSNSSLPGPRGNLELAEAFADIVKDYAEKEPEKLWNLCMHQENAAFNLVRELHNTSWLRTKEKLATGL